MKKPNTEMVSGLRWTQPCPRLGLLSWDVLTLLEAGQPLEEVNISLVPSSLAFCEPLHSDFTSASISAHCSFRCRKHYKIMSFHGILCYLMVHTKFFHNSIELSALLPRIFKAHLLQCRTTGAYNGESGKCQNKGPYRRSK